MALTLHFLFREPLLRNVNSLFDGTQTNWKIMHIRWAAIMTAVVLIETICYVATTPRIVNNPEWGVMILSKCPNANIAEAFETKSMTQAGLVGIGFGSYLGLLFHARIHPGLMLRTVTSDTHWYTWPLLRVLLGVFICVPVLSLGLLKTDQIANVYVLALISTFFPTMVSGFLIFGTLDWICIKVKILTFASPQNEARDDDSEYSSVLN